MRCYRSVSTPTALCCVPLTRAYGLDQHVAKNGRELDEASLSRLRWLLAVAVSASIFITSAIMLTLKGLGSQQRRWRRRTRVVIRLSVSAVAFVLPAALAPTISALDTLWILNGLVFFQVCLDLYGRVHKQHLREPALQRVYYAPETKPAAQDLHELHQSSSEVDLAVEYRPILDQQDDF